LAGFVCLAVLPAFFGDVAGAVLGAGSPTLRHQHDAEVLLAASVFLSRESATARRLVLSDGEPPGASAKLTNGPAVVKFDLVGQRRRNCRSNAIRAVTWFMLPNVGAPPSRPVSMVAQQHRVV